MQIDPDIDAILMILSLMPLSIMIFPAAWHILSENTVREIELRDVPKLAAFCEKVLIAAKTQDDNLDKISESANRFAVR